MICGDTGVVRQTNGEEARWLLQSGLGHWAQAVNAGRWSHASRDRLSWSPTHSPDPRLACSRPLFPLPTCLQLWEAAGRSWAPQRPGQPAALAGIPEWKEWLRLAPAARVPASNMFYN